MKLIPKYQYGNLISLYNGGRRTTQNTNNKEIKTVYAPGNYGSMSQKVTYVDGSPKDTTYVVGNPVTGGYDKANTYQEMGKKYNPSYEAFERLKKIFNETWTMNSPALKNFDWNWNEHSLNKPKWNFNF